MPLVPFPGDVGRAMFGRRPEPGVPCVLRPLVAATGSAGVPFTFKPPGTLLTPGVFVAVGVLPTDGFNEVIGAPALFVPKARGLLKLALRGRPSIANCAVIAARALSSVCAGLVWQN